MARGPVWQEAASWSRNVSAPCAAGCIQTRVTAMPGLTDIRWLVRWFRGSAADGTFVPRQSQMHATSPHSAKASDVCCFLVHNLIYVCHIASCNRHGHGGMPDKNGPKEVEQSAFLPSCCRLAWHAVATTQHSLFLLGTFQSCFTT